MTAPSKPAKVVTARIAAASRRSGKRAAFSSALARSRRRKRSRYTQFQKPRPSMARAERARSNGTDTTAAPRTSGGRSSPRSPRYFATTFPPSEKPESTSARPGRSATSRRTTSSRSPVSPEW